MSGYHEDVIVASFFGHDHVDTFSIMKDTDGGSGASIAFKAGSGSPRNDHNPSVTLWKYSAEAPFTILDKYVFYYDLAKANKNGSINWMNLYHMTTEYNISDCSTASMQGLAEKLAVFKSDAWNAFYENMYAKAEGHTCSEAGHKKKMCSMNNVYSKQADACQDM